MLSFDEGEEVFFDTVDNLSSEESVVATQDLGNTNLGYEIWKSEPKSVKERRQSFLHFTGFLELAPSPDLPLSKGSEVMDFERVIERSGAVSSSCVDKSKDCYGKELDDGGACCKADELDQDRSDDVSVASEKEAGNGPFSVQLFDECKNVDIDKKQMRSWWKSFKNTMKRNAKTPKISGLKVRQNKKRCMEFSGVYVGQEFRAHEGLIWTMKFSPDGKYLASGGEDGIVRIWRVTSVDASSKSLCDEYSFGSQGKEVKSRFGMKKSCHASVIIPNKVFQIEELPLQEFRGHSSDVLDLAWSNSNCLLSSSKDKTVRLWQVGCDKCLSVFHHNNYVTCIQFNPIDENYFISGSIDGKVRIWGVLENRVVDWADVRDVVTAICYQKNGKGFIVGSLTGTCRFYEELGNDLLLNAEMHIHSRKKSSGHKITSIQFLKEDSQRVMITSEDSKVRILDGIDVVRKYKGLPKSGSQMSASFTSTGRHIISVGEDSHIYIWNYDETCVPSSKTPKSLRSCEHFCSDGVSVAIPWSGMGMEHKALDCGTSPHCCLRTQDHQEASSWVRGDSECFSLANWRNLVDGSCKGGGSATWPEEKLPFWDVQTTNHKCRPLSATWGLVIVAAGSDGMITTFHNYGLPVRI